jgi:hypothetical protein
MNVQLNIKKIINMLFYLYIDGQINFMQFHYHLIVYQRPLNFHTIYNDFNLTIFDELSNNNEIE